MKRALFALLLLSPLAAGAQALPGANAITDPLTVTVEPRYPRPGETVRIRPSSTLIDLAASTIVVSANGTEIGRGSGTQSYPMTVGGPGSSTTVRVSVTGPDGTNAKTIVIRPADVSLVLDAVSTAHPFYKGGLLPAPEGRVRVVAIADMRTAAAVRIPPGELTYTWRVGGRLLQAESGIGKSVLTATAPVLFRDAEVSVVVSNRDSSIVGEARLMVSPTEPSMQLYADGPLSGPWFSRALSGTYAMMDSETSFRAVPYFFSSVPGITWTLGSTPAGYRNTVTLRTTGGDSGASSLFAEATQSGKYFSAERELTVRFGQGRNTGLFGL